jgi:undecaprenyl-diphosphatase
MHDPITYFQAIILGLLQGVAEPFPISSLGHGVILPRLAGWNIHQNDKFFITFLVATHLATAIVLFGFFFGDWVRIFKGMGRSLRDRVIAPEDHDARLGWLLVVGTIPVGIIGLLLEDPLRHVFASAVSAAAFLVVNGIALLVFERLRKRPPAAPAPAAAASAPALADGRRKRSAAAAAGDHAPREDRVGGDDRVDDVGSQIAGISWRQAVLIGTAQAAGLMPGLSRSGFSMGGGLLAGLSNETAARYGFLLATPIIGAAAALKLPELLGPTGNGVRGPAVAASVAAALTTFLAVKFLLRFFETNRLTPFGIYCIGAGTICLLVFSFGG